MKAISDTFTSSIRFCASPSIANVVSTYVDMVRVRIVVWFLVQGRPQGSEAHTSRNSL